MSVFLALGTAIALAVPVLSRGSYTRLFTTDWRAGWLLGAGLAIQVALGLISARAAHWHDAGYLALVASYVIVLAFCGRNLVHRGVGIVMLGIACNALAVTLNHGMPVKVPSDWLDGPHAVENTLKHHVRDGDDKLLILSDAIVLRPLGEVISFGDLIIVVGLANASFHASRRFFPRGSAQTSARTRAVRMSTRSSASRTRESYT